MLPLSLSLSRFHGFKVDRTGTPVDDFKHGGPLYIYVELNSISTTQDIDCKTVDYIT